MRSTRTLALTALVLMAAVPAGAGYRSLDKAWKNYEPPAFYQANLAPAEVPAVPAPAKGQEAYAAAKAKLQEAKAQWEKALAQGSLPGTPFYAPNPERVAKLRGAATDLNAAEAALGDGFSLEDLQVLALLRNPGVAAAEGEVRAALERYSEASNLDDILRQYTAFTEGLRTGVGPMKGREPVQMRFPFPGMLALKGEVVTQEVEAARQSLAIARRTAVTGARTAYWNLLFVRRARELTGEMLDLLKRLDSVATTRYEAGKTSFQDVIKVRINRETLQENLHTLVEQEGNVVAKIRQILALPPSAAVGTPAAAAPAEGVPELEPLYAEALERKQELLRMRAMIGKMERMIEMAETRVYPGYALNLSLYQDEAVNQVGTFRMKEPFAVETTASAGVGLPKMPWYGTDDAYLRETRAKLAALRDDLGKAEDQTGYAVREAWFRLDQASREKALYGDTVVNLSQAALEVSTRGYETGRVMFADVISSYQEWLKDNLALERRRADLGITRADLEAAVGVSPLTP